MNATDATAPEELTAAALRLRLLGLDVDGVLTDGLVYVGPQGEVMKSFCMRDGHGLRMLASAGVELILITREKSPITEARAAKLGIEWVLTGVKDKRRALRGAAEERGLSAEAVGFVGDDLFDLEAMDWAAFSACPADAEPKVLASAGFVSSRPGGRGAVRDVANFLLEARGQ